MAPFLFSFPAASELTLGRTLRSFKKALFLRIRRIASRGSRGFDQSNWIKRFWSIQLDFWRSRVRIPALSGRRDAKNGRRHGSDAAPQNELAIAIIPNVNEGPHSAPWRGTRGEARHVGMCYFCLRYMGV
jgi:hypothetical protein